MDAAHLFLRAFVLYEITRFLYEKSCVSETAKKKRNEREGGRGK